MMTPKRLACRLGASVLGLAMASNALAEDRAAQVEQDWLTQARVRNVASVSGRNVSAVEDAIGGCDGVKDGKFGFHTDMLPEPAWWQVDLGKVRSISRVALFNRCDFPTRTARLEVFLSADGKNWKRAYRHNGTPFQGFTDGKPLVISLNNAQTRFVRLQVPEQTYFHLDEVEVYGPEEPQKNLALHQPADQSSVSQWSAKKSHEAEPEYPVAQTLARGRKLAADLEGAGVNALAARRTFDEIERDAAAPNAQRKELYLRGRATIRQLVLANPLLDFDNILFVKRAPGVYSHMSDQYYSWWSRPGGGVFALEGIKSGKPRLRCLTEQFAQGSFLSPDLSFDGKKVLFSYCRFYPGRSQLANKVDKEAQPEDSFYHIFEMNVDGSGLRQITHGRYDDVFPRFLPSGEIVFLSTRRGTFLQCGQQSASLTLDRTLPDSYVRCGGGPSRPVAIYTLHTMDSQRQTLRAISAFESFEWDPSVSDDGRIYYARWDYVDRHNGPFMKLWSTNPDGTNPRSIFRNFTRNPQSTFEARSIPNSRKLLLTAAPHHSITGGSLVLLDPGVGGLDGPEYLERLTPEVCFPETEGWPQSYYANPYPLSEKYYLTGWSAQPILSEGRTNPANALGLYLYDAFGNLELLYRDPEISSMYPLPLRARRTPPVIASNVEWDGPQEGRLLVQNVYASLDGITRGTVTRLRVVAMPIKVQPTMNSPVLGVTAEDPGKCILGTVPVEADGSAYFRVPSGVSVFLQALDRHGQAIQTMRSLTYVQPGQTLSCVGCHETRINAPGVRSRPIAARREPSRITPEGEGTWPLRYDRLVQPVLEKHCVSCHRPGESRFDLTAAKSYDSLVGYGKPSLADHVKESWNGGRSLANAGPSHTSELLAYLKKDPVHREIKLDNNDFRRLVTWMDTYAQRQGHFSEEQEEKLIQFRKEMAGLMER